MRRRDKKKGKGNVRDGRGKDKLHMYIRFPRINIAIYL